MIAFHSNSAEQSAGDVFVVPATGGRVRNVTSYPSTDAFASFSHDGQWIYFSSNRGGVQSIWRMPVSGGDAVSITRTAGINGPGELLSIESSDGSYLYFVATRTLNAPGPLWQLPLKGGAAVKLAEGVLNPSFDVIDSGIYYLEQSGAETRLRYLDLARRRSTVVAANLGTVGSGISATRDGRTILFSRVDSSLDDLMLVENFR